MKPKTASSTSEALDESMIDQEISETEKSIRETEAQIEKLEKQARLKEKQNQLAKMKAKLERKEQKLKAATEKGETETISHKTDSDVTAADLRKDKKLKKQAIKKMINLGLYSDENDSSDSASSSSSKLSEVSDQSDSGKKSKKQSKSKSNSGRTKHRNSDFSSESDSSSSSSSSSSKSHHKKKSKRKSKKSGMSKKASDKVKNPQIWPHSVLQYEFVSEHMPFKKLSQNMFFCGELEILTSRISKSEFKGRILFLKKIAYYANMYDWDKLLHFYAAWLRRIEMGLNKWSDDPSIIENAMLSSKSVKLKSDKNFLSKSDQTWWCPDFNNNKCAYETFAHQKTILGHPRMVKHICGACWRKDKKQLKHPESSTACPHKV